MLLWTIRAFGPYLQSAFTATGSIKCSPERKRGLHGFKSFAINISAGIAGGIAVTGLIGVDYMDIQHVFSHAGAALIGVGHGTGASRARDAAQRALENPLLNGREIGEAAGMYIDIAATSNTLTIEAIGDALGVIQESTCEDSRIFCGTAFDTSLGGKPQVAVLAAIPNALTKRATIKEYPNDGIFL